MSEPVINCSPEIIADLERKIVTLQSKLERAELSEANLSVWKRSAEISIEAQADTISRLTADNEALRKQVGVKHDECNRYVNEMIDAKARADALAQEVERKDAALRRIAEGNLGDASWQADYDKIREVARAALGDRP